MVVLDTMGELQNIYSLAWFSFCGGSLEPLGGQNLMEAAVWGAPVLYGPSVEDFAESKSLLEKSGGGLEVTDGEDLYRQVYNLVKYPEQIRKKGAAARSAVLKNSQAAPNHVRHISRLFEEQSGRQ